MSSDSIPWLFSRSQAGCRHSSSLLYDVSFHRLHHIAASLMRKEAQGHTLPPTALVSELFLKMYRVRCPINSEEHFFRVAARAMRQVLIDHSRSRNSKKRLTDYQLVELLPTALSAARQTEAVLTVRRLMAMLEELDPTAAESMRRRYIEGYSLEEVAALQQRETWRVRGDLKFATQWLLNRYNS